MGVIEGESNNSKLSVDLVNTRVCGAPGVSKVEAVPKR